MEQAKRAYRQAIIADPKLPHAYYDLAQLMETTGESPAETLLTYKQFISLAEGRPDFAAHVRFAKDRVLAIKAAGWATQPSETPAPRLKQPGAAPAQQPARGMRRSPAAAHPAPQRQEGDLSAVNRAVKDLNEGVQFARNMQELAGNIDGFFAANGQAAQPANRGRTPAKDTAYRPGAVTRLIAFILRWTVMLVGLLALVLAVVSLFDAYNYCGLVIFLVIFGIGGFILASRAKGSRLDLGRYNWFMLIYLIVALMGGVILFLLFL